MDRTDPWDGAPYQPDPVHEQAAQACVKFLRGQPLTQQDRDALRMEVFVADSESQTTLF